MSVFVAVTVAPGSAKALRVGDAAQDHARRRLRGNGRRHERDDCEGREHRDAASEASCSIAHTASRVCG